AARACATRPTPGGRRRAAPRRARGGERARGGDDPSLRAPSRAPRAEGPRMTPRNLLAELATVREQLVACDEEREAIEHAPVPITEALARANREVDEVLAGWNPNAFFRRYHLPQMPSRPPSS